MSNELPPLSEKDNIVNVVPQSKELGIGANGIVHIPLTGLTGAINTSILRSDYVFPDNEGNDLIRITPMGFFFKGHEIVDAGRVYDAFVRMLEARGYMRSHSPRDRNVSFLSEQQALNEEPRVRAQEMMIDPRDIEDAPGTVRIHRKKTEWMMALATQKVIPNTLAAVKEYLNEGNPNPYTEQQLATVAIEPDRRRRSKGCTVTINISGDGPNEIAFLSGPLAD